MSGNDTGLQPDAIDAEKDDRGWLLYHSVGRFPGQREAVSAVLAGAVEGWCALDERRWPMLDAGRERYFAAMGRLLNAAPGTLFAAENVTTAFAKFIDALSVTTLRGRRVLIAADCFPSLHYLMAGLADRIGFTLVTVMPGAGLISVHDEDMLAAWDERVALAVVTWVTSTASHRADLARLVAHGQAMGSLVAIDATQGLGVIPFDAPALGIDFAAGTALKWMCGVPGASFGYVRPGLLQALSPRLRGWFGKPDPFDWSLDNFRFASGARRFDTGTPSYLPFIASIPGIEWLLCTGLEQVRLVNLHLSEQLIAMAQEHRIAVASPLDAARRGGSVMLELPITYPAADMVATLARSGLQTDSRGQRLRLSPGPCTGIEAVQRLDRAFGIAFRDRG
jgi:kynureninase